ncbi:hypothetical protein [Rhodopirellula sp. SWK7]|uniref:hypothetical protein n=1 Tax=Rhodopirellula sp. SWK7 TaxID=595460 RepID=UPI0002BDEA42|nr:hypothetical protein [Rhodopirellula sp. SWK7]EMI40533.1 primosome, DnaD subunit [Rhodopirellula sp. SWK7]
MKTGTTSHPKFRSLQKRLDLPIYAVVGILESVWMMAGQFADDGDLSRFTNEQISDAVDWSGDADELIDALVEFRWLDRIETGLMVHDWLEHCPKYVQDRLSKRQKRADEKRVVGGCRGKSETVAENRGLPNPTQPIPTKPNQNTASNDPVLPSKTKSKKKQARTYSADFERFWSVYWNKSNKATAADAFEDALAVIVDDSAIPTAICRATALDWLVQRTELYARNCPETAEPLHPSTYLNKQRWGDELRIDRIQATTHQDSLPEMQSRFRRPSTTEVSS